MGNTITDSSTRAFPKTYLGNELRQSSKYYFISYSHKDREEVFAALTSLYENSVNYWYDVDLDPGDKWNERVKVELNDGHCVGGIVFLSINSLKSEAVRKEIEMMQEREKETSFRIIPVLISASSLGALGKAFVDEDESNFCSDGSQIIYQLRDNIYTTLNTDLSKIIEIADKDGVSNKNKLNAFAVNLHDLPFSSDYTGRKYKLGKYPFDENGSEKEIEWIAVKNIHEHVYLVSKYYLDFIDYNKIDDTVAFIKDTIKEDNCLEDISIIHEEMLSEVPRAFPTDYADSNRRQLLRLYWVLSDNPNIDGKYCLYNGENVKITNAIDYSQINAGIRLILQINSRKIGG